jgi:hypothetical protein
LINCMKVVKMVKWEVLVRLNVSMKKVKYLNLLKICQIIRRSMMPSQKCRKS